MTRRHKSLAAAGFQKDGQLANMQNPTPEPLTGQHPILVFWERLGDVWNLQSPGIPQLKKWACRLNTLSLERMDRFFCEGKQLFEQFLGGNFRPCVPSREIILKL